MARQWTPMQKRAIDTRDKTLLVSAAAGSGKTATLTERIICSILDEENPMGIEDMLIVTFTRAAVGELRERIGKAIKNAIKENPSNERLLRQLHLLPGAKISTIDSFCADILRANADRVGVNPQFRVADTAEAELIAESVLNGLIGAIYEGCEPEVATPYDFERLADCMTDTKSEQELAVIIRLLYGSTLSSLEGVEVLRPLIDEYDPERFVTVESTRLGAYAISELKAAAGHYKEVFVSIIKEIDLKGNPKSVKLRDTLYSDVELFERIIKEDSYSELHQMLSGLEFCTTPRGYDDTLPPTTYLRNAMKKDILSKAEKIFSFSEDDWRAAYSGLYRELSTLMRVLVRFDRLFRDEKLRRGILEYSDIERYTYECLWQGGERTDVAIAQTKLYSAIYIDEYQDVNSLQNKIFEAVSRPDNRFMVGDIKQSIYGFRSANTKIFADMKKGFPPINDARESPMASIFMSDNFRCDKGVVDFVNDIFDRLFYLLRDSIGYVKEDRLGYSKVHPDGEPKYAYPEIFLADTDAFSPDVPKKKIVPTVVAHKIKQLLESGKLDNGASVTPGDIAIIMRNAKGREGLYAEALSELGIPSAIADTEKFFTTPEVLLALCLFCSIDNPRRDVYLAGLLLSPLFSFTADELTEIKAEGKDSLYECLKSYVSTHEEFTRGRSFLDRLERYRILSEGMPTDELIALLYRETGLFDLASGNGGRDNLMLLYENARKFEAGSYKGLYNFISYINSIINRNNSFDKREAPENSDAVNIITIHSSKGLEFPIVFFVGGEESFGGPRGAQPRYVYKEGFGIGMYVRTPSLLGLVENPTKAIINSYSERQQLEEEARVLYVALTRAREKLYVVAKPNKNLDGYLEEIEAQREYMSEYSVYSLGSYLDFILGMKSFNCSDFNEFLGYVPEIVSECDEDGDFSDGGEDAALSVPGSDDVSTDTEGLSDILCERFRFAYPKSHMTRLPEKVSVSKLYPEILDGASESVTELDGGERVEKHRIPKAGKLPRFLGGKEDDSAKRGIATHLLLQFCNLDAIYKEGAASELDRLVRESFISESDAKLVRLDEAEKFRYSELLSKMRLAKSIYREFRFNVKLPAVMFATEEEAKKLYADEELLVQGVIDCLIEDNEGEYHLIDYKTDRLTRAELSDPELAKQKLEASHSRQLGYYAEAVKKIFGKHPKSVGVYSLPLGKVVKFN